MSEQTSVSDERFDPWADEYFADPVPTYERMRESDPVHWNQRRQMWFLTRYADVMTVLKDRGHFSAAAWQAGRPHMEQSASNVSRDFVGGTMLTNEQPDHTRLRRPANPSFLPKAIRGLEPTIERIADRLLDGVRGRAEWNAIADYAYPLPVLVMAALLGVPEEDEAEFTSLMHAEDALLAIDPRASQKTLDHYAFVGKGLGRFVHEFVERRRAQPAADDLTSALIEEERAGRYSTEELLATVHLMIEAGHVTTVNLIGNGINLLLEDPSRLPRLAADPALATSAVEECLRLDGPVHFVGRIATRDLELHDRRIGAGDIVMTLFPAANRDPDQFPDPHTFIVDRAPNLPTGFGAGIHHCIGASLARVEAAVAFRRLAARHPDLARAGEPVRQPTFELRGFKELPVTAAGR
ncbi:MAG: cytochrome P450 [Mycobacteriales bacterium]